MKKKIGDLTLREIRQFCNKFNCFMCPLIDYCDKEPLDDDFIEALDQEIEIEENENNICDISKTNTNICVTCKLNNYCPLNYKPNLQCPHNNYK